MRQPKHTFPIGKQVEGTKLTPLRLAKLDDHHGGNWAYEFKCACGNLITASISSVRLGRVKSCGCAKAERRQNVRHTHDQIKAILIARSTSQHDKTSCWEWLGCRKDDGYGMIMFSGKVVGTHRASWIVHNGVIPSGLCVLHKCDNPPCVNPDHLFLGTQADNVRDCSSKGRIRTGDRRGEKSGVSPLSVRQVMEIRDLRKTGLTHQQLADMFGICRQSVTNILSRKTWNHV